MAPAARRRRSRRDDRTGVVLRSVLGAVGGVRLDDGAMSGPAPSSPAPSLKRAQELAAFLQSNHSPIEARHALSAGTTIEVCKMCLIPHPCTTRILCDAILAPPGAAAEERTLLAEIMDTRGQYLGGGICTQGSLYYRVLQALGREVHPWPVKGWVPAPPPLAEEEQ